MAHYLQWKRFGGGACPRMWSSEQNLNGVKGIAGWPIFGISIPIKDLDSVDDDNTESREKTNE